MEYNIVTNFKIIQEFKKSEYFKQNLGLTGTISTESGDDRTMEKRDAFAFFYNKRYRTIIYGQGSIAKIMFYVDHYIRDQIMAIYKDEKEFVFDFDEKYVRENGINSYIGSLLREVDSKIGEMSPKEDSEEVKVGEVKSGDPNKLFTNPGQVKWEDLQAYIREKSFNRL